jgi:DNA-binding NarL/FixJ family response regulator
LAAVKNVRVLIADDHEAVRAGVCSILQSRPDVEICGQAVNGRDAVIQTKELKPDLILIDITMPVLDGLSGAKEIHQMFPEIVILFLSIHEGKQMTRLAKLAGGSG